LCTYFPTRGAARGIARGVGASVDKEEFIRVHPIALPGGQDRCNWRAHLNGRRVTFRALMHTRWLGALLTAAVIATYANALSAPFVLDDQASVVQNPSIRDLSNLAGVLRTVPDSPVAGRPLVSLSFALNYAAGGLNPRGYRLVNLALHALCALLLLAVTRRAIGPALAFVVALLWALHPLNSEVVNYISQRTESMMAAFYLLTLYAAIRALGATHPRRWHALATVSCVLGALCKESIATAPLVVALYDRLLVFDSWRETFARRGRLYAGLALSWVIVGQSVAAGAREAVAGFSSGVSPWTYLLNQTVMITEYLRLTVWPDRLSVYYGWPQPLALADVAPYAALVVLLAAATIVAMARVPPLGFLGASFFLTLAPASSIIPVATEVGAERRMYLPLSALMCLVVIGGAAIWRRTRAPATAPATVVVLVAAALAAATAARNRDYQSPVTLARTVVERRPSAVARHMLGEALLDDKQTSEAIRHLKEAVAQGNSRAAYRLGATLYNVGEYEEAIRQLELFIGTWKVPQQPRWLEPADEEIVVAQIAIGRSHLAKQRWAAAAGAGRAALEISPGHPAALLLAADAEFGEQRWAASAAHYAEYLRRQPGDVRALINYGITQVGTENLDGAFAAFARAVDIDPGNARARELLALAQADRARLGADQKPR
jgi:Flp pilus assembly protein TadD